MTMMRPGGTPRAAFVIVAALAIACNRFTAEPQPARFVIAGAHAQLTCEACHTEGRPYQALSTNCQSCHEEDRKSPTHFPNQTCNDAGCHSSEHFAWADVLGVEEGFHDFLPLEGSHDQDCSACHKDTKNYADLEDESAYCWNCHEAERWTEDPSNPQGLHYIQYLDLDQKKPDPRFRWDCGPCHQPVAWSENPFFHAPRSPHGTFVFDGVTCVPKVDETQWVTGCEGCHPGSTANLDCDTCHPDGHLAGSNPLTCLSANCHTSAQPTGCNSLDTPKID
ncbi:MAG: hypothetical protein AAGA48_38360 [Myxococcota bacterium]